MPTASPARVPGLADPIDGYAGITCGAAAWYAAFAHAVNAAFRRALVPAWPLS